MKKWTRFLYNPCIGLKADKSRVTASKEHIESSKYAASQGMVLLKNEEKTLPLKGYKKVVLIGKGSFDYVKGGGGSGEVNCDYVRNIYDGLKAKENIDIFEPVCTHYRNYVEECYKKGEFPGLLSEIDLPDHLLKRASAFSDTAIYTISRFSGENWDRSEVEAPMELNLPVLPDDPNREKGYWDMNLLAVAKEKFPDRDFYLTKEEKGLLEKIKKNFKKVIILLNIGGVIDTKWISDDEDIKAALVIFQAGMEGGSAAADILTGCVNPSGRLTDTYARELSSYPSTDNFFESHDYVEYTEDIFVGYRYFETIPGAKEQVVYPFGYGLSYTEFETKAEGCLKNFDDIVLRVKVTNVGSYAGREVVMIFATAPKNRLEKPSVVLAGFKKTRLLEPGESEIVDIRVDKKTLASYDDQGLIQKSAWILESGVYSFYIGKNARELTKVEDWTVELEDDLILEQLERHLSPIVKLKRLQADGSYIETEVEEDALANEKKENGRDNSFLSEVIGFENEAYMPRETGYEEYHGWDNQMNNVIELIDVAEGKASLEDFMAQLSDYEMAVLLGGQPNRGVADTFGIGNLPRKGVPSCMTADGPAGVRINPCCGVSTTAMPCSTLLASSFDPEVTELIGRIGGEELLENNLGMWLTPAVNIHRNPMCGRNFEYYSEDPLLTGKMASGIVRGVQSNGVSCSVKHFAANNKETNRKYSDSRVSEKALREIYLRAFEIIVKEAEPWSVMSSYNILNGIYVSKNKELLTDVLRNEWGYKGIVTTDWWTRSEHYEEILAGSDVKMACGFPDRVMKAMANGRLSRKDLEPCVRRVLEYILKLR